MQLGNRLELFPEYIHSRLAKAANEQEKLSGKKVLRFSAGTPDVYPSKRYLDKLAELIYAPDAHLYPGYTGIKEFNDGLAAYYKTRFGVNLAANEIAPLLGGKDGIAHLPPVLLNDGDEFLVPDPGYPAFTDPALLFGGVPVPYALKPENDFKLDIAEIESKITSRTKYIWVNYPSNPTGQVASLEEITPLVALAKKHNLLIIYDNCYAEIAFDGFVPPSILQVEGAKDVCIELGSFSKAFSFAGHRMGWFVGKAEVIQALLKVKSQMDSGMWLPLQRLAGFALTNTDEEWKKEMLASYQTRRDIVADKFRTIGCEVNAPKAALYLWCKIPDSAKDAESYTMELLKEKNILVTPGTAFGKNGERYIRVSYCVNIDTIEQYF